MKNCILFISILLFVSSCQSEGLYKDLYKEEVFNKEIDQKEIKIKDYFGASRLDNPVVLSDEYLINLYKARGYIEGITDYSISYLAKTSNQKDCIKKAEKELLNRFQNDKVRNEDKLVKTFNNYIVNECLK